MMFDEQIITQKPSSGASLLDSDPIESVRHSSVFSHFARIPHKGALLQVADTPWGDFPSDALAAVDGSDSCVIVVSATDGVQSGVINAFQHCQKAGIKMMICLSKMDRPFLQVGQVIADLERSLGMKPVPLQVLQGTGDEFEMKSLLVFDDNGVHCRNNVEGLDESWMELEEAVAMTDDELLIEFLENSRLDPKQVFAGLRKGVRQNKILPLVYTSADKDVGVHELMDVMVALLPNPVELRQDVLQAAGESDHGKCGLEAGVEAGFAARVLHTTVDTFGSLSVLRVISNSRNDDGTFHSLPQEAVSLGTGEKIRLPSVSASFALFGKDRVSLSEGVSVFPGDVIAVPKLPESIGTNEILAAPNAVREEEAEIQIETSANVLSPLSRSVELIPLMTSATVSLPDLNGKKLKGHSAVNADKLQNSLASMAREDLSLKVDHDALSSKIMVKCMSGDHLQIIASRLKDKYGLEVELGRPPVQYKETLLKSVSSIEGKHKKQSGGSGQFGVCYISIEPLPEGSGVKFESRIKGGVISQTFIGSVEKGVKEQLKSGGPLGFPVTDVKVILTDGKMHSVDSKDIAFQSAGRLAGESAIIRCNVGELLRFSRL